MANLLNRSSVMMCPHGGSVTAISANTQVKAAGDFVLRSSDTFVVAGCPFFAGPTYHPCVQVQWIQPDVRSQINGDFTLSEQSLGFCVAADQAVQGPVQIVFTQPRVSGE